MKLADSDGNGMLDYEEIIHLAEISLKTNFIFSSINFEEDQFLKDLTIYFTDLIFKICDVDPEDEIDLCLLENLIKNNDPNAEMLLFFCGAD